MEMQLTIKPDLGRVMKRIGDNAEGARKAGMINLVATVEAEAVKRAPVKTSNLARTRSTDIKDNGQRGILKFTAPYAQFVHEGTGLYGPHKTKIVPKNKKALYWPGLSHPVRASKGMKGRPWVKLAAEHVKMDDVFQEGMKNYLNQHGE